MKTKLYYDALGEYKIKGINRYNETWNGWEIILVTQEELIKWLKFYQYNYSIDMNNDDVIIYDDRIDDILHKMDDGLYSLSGYCFSEVIK
jgi:hypothetical protein